MDRAESIVYLTKFTKLATAAGCDPADVAGGFGQAVDSALREMEYTESELADADVEDTDTRAYLALLDYYTLKLLKVYLSTDVDIRTSGADSQIDKKRSQAFQMVTDLLADAREEVKSLGYLDSDFQMVALNTNYIEPEEAGL
jgi:hypothetical protein